VADELAYTEYPCASTCACSAAEMSEASPRARRLMPLRSDSRVTRSRSSALTGDAAYGDGHGRRPIVSLSTTPKSSPTISPSFNTFSPRGCVHHLLVHRGAQNARIPPVPLTAGRTAASRHIFSAADRDRRWSLPAPRLGQRGRI